MTRERGILEDWLDQRGFGFIRRPNGAKLYVHMKSIGKSTERPKTGDNLEYTVTTGKDGRPVATDVTFVAAPPPPAPRARRIDLAGLVAANLLRPAPAEPHVPEAPDAARIGAALARSSSPTKYQGALSGGRTNERNACGSAHSVMIETGPEAARHLPDADRRAGEGVSNLRRFAAGGPHDRTRQ